jgi:hypothetical protein
VFDAPTTVLVVGSQEVHVPYLEGAEEDYDAALVRARDRLASLAGRVTAEGQDYSPDRVLLWGEHLSTTMNASEPWPEGVPMPPEIESGPAGMNYKGDEALTITRSIPHDGASHVFRTSSGEYVALTWHYLLPHE